MSEKPEVRSGLFGYRLSGTSIEMKCSRIDHVALQVSDMARSIEFYRDRLGMTFEFQHLDEEHHEWFAYFALTEEPAGAKLELLQPLDENNRPIPSKPKSIPHSLCPHVAFHTDCLDDWVAHCQQHRIPILKGPLLISGKVRWLYLADPDRNILEFVEWL